MSNKFYIINININYTNSLAIIIIRASKLIKVSDIYVTYGNYFTVSTDYIDTSNGLCKDDHLFHPRDHYCQNRRNEKEDLVLS